MHKLLLALVFVCALVNANAQSNFRTKNIILSNDTVKLDTLSIIPGSFKLTANGITGNDYHIDWYKSLFILHREPQGEIITTQYRVYPINFSQTFAHKTKKNFSIDKQNNLESFKYVGTPPGNDIFDTEGLNKTGSVSRGINFGNNQNLSVNSSLNLQLSGKIKDDVNILASISDDNIPIQPDGNTAQLQDFDQVFIKVFTQKTSLIAGDFWMRRPQGYFMNYNKRVQGIQLAQTFDKNKKWKYTFDVGGALSKGKFSRNVFNGTEGNQGPYRLKGAENEPFIIILAGTEMVYIDGQLLRRGLENDYTIDYNTSEITFTPKNLITKDRRIIVEFQYSEKNYARSIITTSHNIESAKSRLFFNVYSEQDSKNQPLQQTLSDADKRIMAGVGDSIQDAFNSSVDSVAFNSNQILYKKVDTLGYDSVFVFSVSPDSAFFKLQFTNVGAGNGDYVQSTFTALGRVYKWVAPDTIGGFIVHNGNFAPVILLVTPKKRQMINAGWEYKPTKTAKFYIEGAFSNSDVNQFSKIHKRNDDGYALKTGGEKVFRLKHDTTGKALELVATGNAEMVTQTFNRIERFRPVEFERNWNVDDALLNNNQLMADLGLTLRKKNYGHVGLSGNTFLVKNNYTGIMSRLHAQYKRNGWNLNGQGSYLMTDGTRGTAFLRHNTQLSKNIKRFVIGFNDIHEDNRFFKPEKSDSTIAGSYRFYDWEAYAGTNDTLGNRFTVNYRQRTDWLNDSGKINKAAIGRQYGATAAFMKNPKNILRLRGGYRTLEIVDSTLSSQKGDNTIVGRIEHDLRLAKNFFTSSIFYEVSSGLELKREFIYIEVPAGQGTYTWNDYNGNGVKELNEFEIAAYPDQATYIRSFIPSNAYVRTYNNSFSHSISINPAYLIKSSNKKGFKKFISKFADMAYYKVERKTANDIPEQAFNPFRTDIADTSLQSTNSSIRNIFYFNRSSSIFAVDYTVQQNNSKSLLSNGFELRKLYTNEVKSRLSIKRVFTLTTSYKDGQKVSSSDFLNGRNYKIDFYEIKPELAWQPGTNFRWSINYSYLYKQNKLEGGGERTINNNYGTEIRFSTAEKGSIQANFNYVLIDYNGETNTALSFEMLDALKNGKNYTWSASWQQSLSKNLQLNLTYVGRKSENNKMIHTGGVQVRAFF
ncbi:MAG TPA: hypothetical protein VK177_11420 [Flavobacteriales bacterium]|nr:hypothetical protein [Flavobacteriales bacterium]